MFIRNEKFLHKLSPTRVTQSYVKTLIKNNHPSALLSKILNKGYSNSHSKFSNYIIDGVDNTNHKTNLYLVTFYQQFFQNKLNIMMKEAGNFANTPVLLVNKNCKTFRSNLSELHHDRKYNKRLYHRNDDKLCFWTIELISMILVLNKLFVNICEQFRMPTLPLNIIIVYLSQWHKNNNNKSRKKKIMSIFMYFLSSFVCSYYLCF